MTEKVNYTKMSRNLIARYILYIFSFICRKQFGNWSAICPFPLKNGNQSKMSIYKSLQLTWLTKGGQTQKDFNSNYGLYSCIFFVDSCVIIDKDLLYYSFDISRSISRVHLSHQSNVCFDLFVDYINKCVSGKVFEARCIYILTSEMDS